MEVLQPSFNVPFIKYRLPFAIISLLAFFGSLFLWFQSGDTKYGVDFLGGTDVVLRFPDKVTSTDIRKALNEAGFGAAVVQAFEGEEHEFSIRLKADRNADTARAVVSSLEKLGEGGKIEVLKEDFVGPVIGDQIRSDGLKSLAIALIGILIYISVRFEWRFAVGAIVALLHDVVITTGIFILAEKEISAAVLAALLTILGYSINDTIIIFDRIRENFNRMQSDHKATKSIFKDVSFAELVNISINQTLSRTILTSLTTLFVCVSLWLLGGGAIADLSFVLVVGIIIGTFSTVFVASSVVIALDRDFGRKTNTAALKKKVA